MSASDWIRTRGTARAFRDALLTADGQTLNPAGEKIMAALAGFCRAHKSCVIVGRNGQIDTHATAVAEGRREVWLRIQQYLNLDLHTIQDPFGDSHG